jgi:hypothetical protein
METVEQSTVSEPIQQVIFKGDVGQIFREVVDELKKAKRKFPQWPVHIVARAAIVGEEAGELIRASLHHKYESKNAEQESEWMKEMEKEAIQCAAMCIRFIESLRK